MYPFVRLAKDLLVARNATKLPPLGAHVSYHRCWPQDIDWFMEMNNGRILTVMELGRTVLAKRVGLLGAIRDNGWGLTVAGSSIRYRKRIRPFVTFKLVSHAVGWDDKFFYLNHTIWLGEDCAVQGLFRTAATDKNGIVPPQKVFDYVGHEGEPPKPPPWVQAWIDADRTRPWPPELPDDLT